MNPGHDTGSSGTRITFSQELRTLAERFGDRPVPLQAILEATQGRGFHLLLVLISLPFITPIPLPGLSTVFGLVVAVVGARLALGRRPWLPRRLLHRELPPRFLGRLLNTASRIVRVIEYLMKPRMVFMQERAGFRRVSGALIAVSGVLLLVPLPVPFSNFLPALTVVLLAAGTLERDGLFFLGGCAAFLTTLAFFTLLAVGGVEAVGRIRQALGLD